ncbi:MAG: DivIVA domain-containing protein [Actinomycetota bacterium]|nr:DivIVA domain-containing protein [Actinomycetota bacterium]
MALSAGDVHDKQFKLVRNSTGYDMDEVDAFLDEVEAEIARLADELQVCQDQAAAASAAPETQAASAAGARILEMAQRTADDYVADARRTADGMVADAEKAARKSVKKLEAQRRELEGRVGALKTFEAEIRSRLTGYFQSQLEDLSALADGGHKK